MNTGLQDAINLGWKLAMQLKNYNGKINLIKTYEDERRPVGKTLCDSTHKSAQRMNSLLNFYNFIKSCLFLIIYFIPSSLIEKSLPRLLMYDNYYRDSELSTNIGNKG
mmetsp:Transcript_44613/g.37501  ORF Transcript_44613/g.37501 Transcript_44613/m.37501 type:complete len:108 (+) Transcript_44613:432-755(+)